jgi:hypothetical protein
MKNDGSFLPSTQNRKDHQHHLQTSPEIGSKSPESPMGSSNASNLTPEGSHSTPKSPIGIFVSICSKRSRNNLFCAYATSCDALAQSTRGTICYIIMQPLVTL